MSRSVLEWMCACPLQMRAGRQQEAQARPLHVKRALPQVLLASPVWGRPGACASLESRCAKHDFDAGAARRHHAEKVASNAPSPCSLSDRTPLSPRTVPTVKLAVVRSTGADCAVQFTADGAS